MKNELQDVIAKEYERLELGGFTGIVCRLYTLLELLKARSRLVWLLTLDYIQSLVALLFFISNAKAGNSGWCFFWAACCTMLLFSARRKRRDLALLSEAIELERTWVHSQPEFGGAQLDLSTKNIREIVDAVERVAVLFREKR